MAKKPSNEAIEAAKKLDVYREALPEMQTKALQATAHAVAYRARREFTQRGIGRAIWGRSSGFKMAPKPGGKFKKVDLLDKLIHAEKLRGKGRAVGAGARIFGAFVTFSGIPAKVHSGQPFKPHRIESKAAHYAGLASKYAGRRKGELFARRAVQERGRKALVFQGPGGTVYARSVNHPGAHLQRVDVLSSRTEFPAIYRRKLEEQTLRLVKKLKF